jgi:hypothetical protein
MLSVRLHCVILVRQDIRIVSSAEPCYNKFENWGFLGEPSVRGVSQEGALYLATCYSESILSGAGLTR